MRLTPFTFLLIGLAFLFGGTLADIFLARPEWFALARLAMALCFFGAFALALYKGYFKPEHKPYVVFFIVVLVYAIIISAPNYFKFQWVQGFRVTVAMEVAYYSMIAFGMVWLTFTYVQIVRMLQLILSAAVVLFVLTISQMDAGMVAVVETRGQALNIAMEEVGGRGVYNAQMSLAHLYASLFLVVFAVRLKLYWRLASVCTIAFILITAFYYSKRSTLLELVVAIILFVLIHGMISNRFAGLKKFQFVFFGLAVGVAVLFGSYFFGSGVEVLFARLLERFREFFDPTYDIREFSRIQEVKIWFQEAPFLNRFFGGGSMFMHISGATGNITTGLHIGWATIFLKGGPILLAFFAWIYWKNIMLAWKNRNRPSALIGLTLPFYFAAAMLHSTVFGPSFAGLGVALSLFLYPAIFSLENRRQAPTHADLSPSSRRRHVRLPHAPQFRQLPPRRISGRVGSFAQTRAPIR